MDDLFTKVLHSGVDETVRLLVAVFWPFAVKWAKLGLHVVGGKLGDLSEYWMRTMNLRQKAC